MRLLVVMLLAIFSDWPIHGSQSYVYPVAIDQDTVFYVYQKSLTDLELWCLFVSDNSQLQSQHLEKCLYWRFIPAGFTLLPEHKGFSFIDSGRLWVKDFIKRSPSAISFDQPVFNISEVCWLDCKNCYFSAKQKQNFTIFIGNTSEQILKVLYDLPNVECLSPKIVANQLFCIERNQHDRDCAIVVLNFDPKLNIVDLNSKKVIADCGYQQVIYLNMLSDKLGFYIEHMPYIHDRSWMVTLVCHKIEFINHAWKNTKLFKFNIPKKYLFGEERLYESILPFLPRSQKTSLYFSDIKQNESGEYYSSIFSYDLIKDEILEIFTSEPGKTLFAPIICGAKLLYGTVLDRPETTLSSQFLDQHACMLL